VPTVGCLVGRSRISGMESMPVSEAVKETEFWLSQPGIHDDVAEADAALEAGQTVSAGDVRERFGLSPAAG